MNSVSNIIVKHRHGLVTDCHHLPMVPMVPIVPQSAPMVSVAVVSVKLYNLTKLRFSRQKLAIYSYFWARPPTTLTTPLPKIWGMSRPSTSQGLTHLGSEDQDSHLHCPAEPH